MTFNLRKITGNNCNCVNLVRLVLYSSGSSQSVCVAAAAAAHCVRVWCFLCFALLTECIDAWMDVKWNETLAYSLINELLRFKWMIASILQYSVHHATWGTKHINKLVYSFAFHNCVLLLLNRKRNHCVCERECVSVTIVNIFIKAKAVNSSVSLSSFFFRPAFMSDNLMNYSWFDLFFAKQLQPTASENESAYAWMDSNTRQTKSVGK